MKAKAADEGTARKAASAREGRRASGRSSGERASERERERRSSPLSREGTDSGRAGRFLDGGARAPLYHRDKRDLAFGNKTNGRAGGGKASKIPNTILLTLTPDESPCDSALLRGLLLRLRAWCMNE